MPQIAITGAANLKPIIAEFAALEKQVEAMNHAMAKSSMIPAGGTPAGYAKTARAVNAATHAYNGALQASGAYNVQQMKINDNVAKNTELLQRQKLAFNQVFGRKARGQMQAVYREQLAMQRAMMMQQTGMVGDGKTRMSLAIPTEVHKSWDTLNNRVGMFGYRLASASSELVNWGKNMQWAGRQLMVGLTMPVAAFGAAAGVMAYQVDKQLTRIAKVYDTTADANSKSLQEQAKVEKELNDLREAGIETSRLAAREYGASITDTLEVQAELAATGQAGARLQESTAQVMRIAALGEIEQADATKALISLQSVLGLTVKETADAFNYMNSIENATSLSTNDFVAAIPRALGPMKEMGGTLQDLAVLMVAMKERGIEAGEGANAIKAMMQRLYRPSQQVREEWQQIAKVDPLKFVEESGGNVMEILPKIAAATQDLQKADRVKLLAGLFGTYQVTRMSAMLDGLSDMQDGIGQTSRVLDVNAQSWQDWSATAERELQKQQESASGQFKRTLEMVKVELADLGDPFLEVASMALKAIGAVLGFINQLPEWAKKGLIFAAMLGAIVGPIVMLIGLFANFAGNIGKFAGTLLKITSNFELLNREQWATRTAAYLSQKGFIAEASAAEILEKQIRGLTIAHSEYAAAMMKYAQIPITPQVARNLGISPQQAMTPTGNTQSLGMPLGMANIPSRNTSTSYYHGAKITQTESDADYKQRVDAAQRVASAERDVLRNKIAQQQPATALARINERSANAVSGMGVSMGVASAAMGTMMITSNETANSIAKWALIGTLVVPAAKMLFTITAATAKSAWSFAAAQGAAAAASMRASGGMLKVAGVGAGLRTMAMGLGRGLLSVFGPVGLIATGLLAIGAFMYKAHKEREQMIKDEIAAQEALNKSAQDWADILDVAHRKRGTLASAIDVPGGSSDSIQMADEYRNSESGKAILAKYNSSESTELERQTIALSEYLTILRETKATLPQAQRAMEIFYIATGDGALEAQRKAQELTSTYFTLDASDTSKLWAMQFEDGMNDAVEVAYNKGQQIGDVLADSLVDAKDATERSQIMDSLATTITSSWETMFDSFSDQAKRALSEIGVDKTNVNQFLSEYNSAMNSTLEDQERFMQKWNLDGMKPEQFQEIDGLIRAMIDHTGGLRNIEKGIVRNLADQKGIAGDINTLAELRATFEWQAFQATKRNAKALVEQQLAYIGMFNGVQNLFGANKEITKEQRLAVQNTVRNGMGLQSLNHLTNNWADETEKVNDKAKDVGRTIDGIGGKISFKADQMSGILQEGMQGVQSDIADRLSDSFSSQMDSAIDANSDYWDNRTDALADAQERASAALERQQEKETRAFESRWERRRNALEKVFDARIEKVNEAIEQEQKAEEIRQRIFDAEQARLDRMTEATNRTIDFNMALQEGNLDEAAKIRNDMDAAAQQWALSDAAGASGSRSERRQQRLQDKADKLGNRKDKALEALEKREEAERRSLERRQEMEQAHLEKVQEMNSEALEEQAEAAKESYQKEWEYRRESLEDQLATFQAFVPKNMRELEKWMKEVGITYDKFGDRTLDPKSKQWAKWFKDRFKENIRDASLDVASANYWEGMGNRVAKKTLLGMGFGSMKAFKKFVETGNIPENFGRRPKNNNGNNSPSINPNVNSDATVKAAQGGAGGGTHIAPSSTHKVMGGATGPGGLTSYTLARALATGVGKAFRKVYDDTKVASNAAAAAGQGVMAATGNYVPGSGKRTRPIANYGYGSIHGTETGYPAVDFAAPVGTPIRAVANGLITRSYDIKGPLSTDTYNGDGPYGSYGKVIYLKTEGGPEVLYAHLSQRSVKAGQRVPGGSVIGYTGNTGNSSGPHLHFGATNGPLAWLKTGGMTLNDGIAALHRGETVLTRPLSEDLQRTVRAFGEASKRKASGRSGGTGSDKNLMWGKDSTKIDRFKSGAWTWLNGMPFLKDLAKVGKGIAKTGAKAMIKIGTLNTTAGVAAANTQKDLARLIPKADFLALTEVTSKFDSLQRWLNKRNWGLIGGRGREQRESVLAYNRNTQKLERRGIRKLGDKTNNSIVGGPMKRYANYGKFTDRASGKKTWQVSAHTVPTPRMSAKHRPLFMEQWGNLDKLVNDLSKSAPVFVAGDLNNNPNRNWWRTPGRLNEFAGEGVDWIFGDPRFSKLLGKRMMRGMHGDHGKAVLANFALPSARDGAERIRWDNTLVNTHKDESILTAGQSNNFRYLADNLDKIAMGGGNQYTIKVDATGTNVDADEIVNKTVTALKKIEARKPQRRR